MSVNRDLRLIDFKGWEDRDTFRENLKRLTQGLAENYAAIGPPQGEA